MVTKIILLLRANVDSTKPTLGRGISVGFCLTEMEPQFLRSASCNSIYHTFAVLKSVITLRVSRLSSFCWRVPAIFQVGLTPTQCYTGFMMICLFSRTWVARGSIATPKMECGQRIVSHFWASTLSRCSQSCRLGVVRITRQLRVVIPWWMPSLFEYFIASRIDVFIFSYRQCDWSSLGPMADRSSQGMPSRFRDVFGVCMQWSWLSMVHRCKDSWPRCSWRFFPSAKSCCTSGWRRRFHGTLQLHVDSPEGRASSFYAYAGCGLVWVGSCGMGSVLVRGRRSWKVDAFTLSHQKQGTNGVLLPSETCSEAIITWI